MTEKKKVCMLCGKPSEESICESCKSNVQGEAAHKKQKMEKHVKVGSEVEKDRIVRKHIDK
ncbi:MAG: hypothetical protein IH823_04775 [Candidatus Dadabacteria bacterium]|nr:hypothetical protein [Candidatus Dadabacteria bacterium]MCH8014087.1 hypothetical protein [Candidatus Dadabacteria bacterium]